VFLSPRPSALARLDRRAGEWTIRLVATALAGLVLTGGAAAALDGTPVRRTATVRTVVAPTLAVAPSPVAVATPAPRPAPKAAPTRRTAKRPATKAVRKKPVVRWLPVGTGMWLHEYERTEGGNPRAIVARAQHMGLSVLYVQTGSSKKGWIGTPALTGLLRATKGTGISVIAWDFPKLNDPVGDARRLARAASFHCGGCARVAAVAPDVETAAEGTRIGDAAVARYYTALRRALPAKIAILATVPWPSEKRVGRYPYARTASLADAIMPMAYWYNRDPAHVTATSMGYLSRLRKPIMPVGQGYDGRLDAPYLKKDLDPFGSVAAFLATARDRGAQHVSLWSWQTTGGHQWSALAKAHKAFGRKAAR
jgi:hypothetical protein